MLVCDVLQKRWWVGGSPHYSLFADWGALKDVCSFVCDNVGFPVMFWSFNCLGEGLELTRGRKRLGAVAFEVWRVLFGHRGTDFWRHGGPLFVLEVELWPFFIIGSRQLVFFFFGAFCAALMCCICSTVEFCAYFSCIRVALFSNYVYFCILMINQSSKSQIGLLDFRL